MFVISNSNLTGSPFESFNALVAARSELVHGAKKVSGEIGRSDDDRERIAGQDIGLQGQPLDQVGGGLDDVTLTGLSVEPESEGVRRSRQHRAQLGWRGRSAGNDVEGDALSGHAAGQRVS